MLTSPEGPSIQYDVVVLGTGAAGLTAAVTAAGHGASVGLFEKGDVVGGTTAFSGGMVWIPNNPHMLEISVDDSRDEALVYLESLSHGLIEPALAEAYVDRGPEMVSWMEANTPLRLEIVRGYPDYHPEHPGGKPKGGRSMEPKLFSFHELGSWATKVARGPQLTNAHMLMAETPQGAPGPYVTPPEVAAERREKDLRGLGQGLVGRLLKGCLDRGVEPVLGVQSRELIVANGRVTGVRLDGPDGPFEALAHGGVVLATGGFEWDEQLLRSFIRGPLTRNVSPRTNTGDGLKMAMKVGASLGNMREAWWVPIIDVPGEDGQTISWLVMTPRSWPRIIMVNRAGKRFTNEAANYNASGAAFHEFDPTSFEWRNLPAWLVFDHGYLQRYGFVSAPAGDVAPAWVTEAPTLAELARRIGVDPAGLEHTVEVWNANVAKGHDPDFRRGVSAHDRWWGDPRLKGSPAATLGPLDTAPFYAVEVHPGSLGTKGGPRTNGDGQVLGVHGEPIPGLYAAGNTMASAMGMTYGGAGGTLGPAMVFGFLSGRDAARVAQAPR